MKIISTDTVLKNYFDNAKDTLLDWENGISNAERQLALLSDGDKHETVYQAFRDVVLFSCYCIDDIKGAAKTFGKEWEAVKPRTNTNPYRHPIDFVIARSGVRRDGIKGSDALCRWAKIAETIHPLITKGTITEETFIDFIRRKGGIRGYYNGLTKTKKAGKLKAGGVSSADFDKAFSDMKANQAKDNERKLVAVVFDITDSRTYPSVNRLAKAMEGLNECISVLEIDKSILELMEEGGEANA